MPRTRLSPALVSAGLATMLLLTAAVGVQAMAATGRPVAALVTTSDIRRSVEWATFPDNSPAALWIVSTSVNAPAPDEFKITYNHGTFALAYERNAGGPVTSQFAVTVAGLVEWLPAGDGTFSDGALVAYTPLGAPAFGRVPIVHMETNTSGGIAVHSFLIQSNSGEVTLNLTISQGFVTLPSGSILTPMEAELTIQVNHVMNRTDTRLSIQLGLTTNNPSQTFSLENQSWDDAHEFSTDERAVNVTNDLNPDAPSSAFFAWSNHAQVNGQSSDVAATGPEANDTTGGYDLYLSYPRTLGTNPIQMDVVHDPSLGVVSAAYQSQINQIPPSTIQPDIPLYAGSMVVVAALVTGTVLLARRQRRQGR